MDKMALMETFKSVVSNASGMVMSQSCKLCAVPLTGLKRLDMREAYVRTQQLKTDSLFEGRVVYGKISNSTALPQNRTVLCVVEQEDELATSFLHIFNAVTSTSKQEDGELLFPKDVRVAIKEPVCFSAWMQVSSPACVELLGLSNNAKPVESLVKEGNALLSKGRLVLADLYYSEALGKPELKNSDRFPEYGALKKEALWKRAEARLQLGRYEEAFMDTEAALKIPEKKHHWRVMWSKGKALTALQEHKLALASLESAASEAEVLGVELKRDVERSKTFVRQSENGEYNISEFVLRGFDTKFAPECSDYFGPVELKLTSDGRGRGMFLTRDAKPGELLLVCDAAMPRSETLDDEYVDLIWKCIASDRLLKQVYSLAHVTEMDTVPDTTPLRCNTGKVVPKQKDREIDISRIRRVRLRNSFANDAEGGGLWCSCSLTNHSCLPTVSRTFVGRFMFMRAAKHLKAGAEVLHSYKEFTLMAPLAKREEIRMLGFECRCERCMVERRNSRLLAKFGRYEDECGSVTAEKRVEWALEVEQTLRTGPFTSEEKDWIRAGLVKLYSAVCKMKNPELPSVREYIRILHETVPGSIATFVRMAGLYNDQCGAECLEMLREGFAALVGEQKEEVFDVVMNRLNPRWR